MWLFSCIYLFYTMYVSLWTILPSFAIVTRVFLCSAFFHCSASKCMLFVHTRYVWRNCCMFPRSEPFHFKNKSKENPLLCILLHWLANGLWKCMYHNNWPAVFSAPCYRPLLLQVAVCYLSVSDVYCIQCSCAWVPVCVHERVHVLRIVSPDKIFSCTNTLIESLLCVLWFNIDCTNQPQTTGVLTSSQTNQPKNQSSTQLNHV